MPCCGFSRSSLWQLACTNVKYEPLFTEIWFLSNHPCTRPSSWLPGKTPGCQERYWYSHTHCVLRETGQMPIFFYWFGCTIRFWNSLLSSNNPLLEKIVRADLLLANRSYRWTHQVRHALQSRFTYKSQQLLTAIRSRQTINLGQFELTLREHIIGGWRDLDIWHHMKLIIPAELWGHITHISVYLRGILLDGGMTEKEIKSLCCLFTFAWTFPATSAANFLAFSSNLCLVSKCQDLSSPQWYVHEEWVQTVVDW